MPITCQTTDIVGRMVRVIVMGWGMDLVEKIPEPEPGNGNLSVSVQLT